MGGGDLPRQKAKPMIKVTRLNGSQLYVNAEMVYFVESTPDTIVSLANGEKVLVRESPEQLVAAIVAYQRRVRAAPEPRLEAKEEHL